MSFPFDTNDMAFPGFESILETVQNQFWWGRNEQQTFLPATISGAARDSANTVPDVLRGGLILGKVTATGLYKEWNPTGTDGSEIIAGILMGPLKVTDAGSNADRYTFVYVGGNALSDRILIPGEADEGIVGHAQEHQIADQLHDLGVRLDRHTTHRGLLSSKQIRLGTTAEMVTNNAVTVTEGDHGSVLLMTGADGDVTFTLPAAEVGLEFTIVANVATHSAIVALASGNIAIPGNVAATTITLAPGESATFVGISAGLYQLMNYTQVDAT
jgi:hypothetical protein